MPSKRSSRKILLRIAVAMIPLAILFGVLVYAKLYGFKRALSELVQSKTNGLYTLSIGHSSIDWLALTFTLDDVKISRTSAAPAKGIREVTIPYMQLQFGSIASISMVRQFDIQNLIIDEPVIEIDAQQRSTVKHSNTNLSYQVVKLYPAIESLLGRFDIESLSIRRATVGMKNVANTSVKLNLIDLLVEHWNIQELTPKSQFQLKVGGQALAFPKASLNFSGIEFNFRQHHLLFSDFSFSSLDTVSQSKVEVSGKSLLLQKLDYKALYENQRYAIKRAVIDRPNVVVEFKLKENAKVKDRDLLTRIVKQAIGECSIDSTVIRDARVHLVVQKDRDSVKIDLPHVNINVYSFKVIRDSSAFQVGGLEVGLDRTAIALKRNFSFNCNAILFDQHRDLTLTDVVLYDSSIHKNIATCGKLKLKYFNLLDFAFDKKIRADGLTLEDAEINITPERVRQNAANKKEDDRIEDIAIRSLALKNVTMRYADALQTIRVNKLSVTVNNLKRGAVGDFQYNLGIIRFSDAFVKNTSSHLESRMKGVDFDGKLFRAAEVDVKKDSLHFYARNMMALKDGEESIRKNHRRWVNLYFNRLEITGKLPQQANNKNKPQDLPFESIDHVSIDNIVIAAHQGNKRLSFSGKNLIAEKITAKENKITFTSAQGQLSDVNMHTPDLAVSAEQIKMDYPKQFLLRECQFRKNNLRVELPYLELETIEQDENFWAIHSLKTKKIEIFKNEKSLFVSDSIRLLNAEMASDEPPFIKDIEVYNPLLTLHETKQHHVRKNEDKAISLAMVRHFIIHPGKVKWKGDKSILFGRLEGDTKNGTLNCASLRSETERMTIQAYDILLKNNKISIDSVRLKPRKDWIVSNAIENDIIDVSFQGITMQGFSTEYIVESRKMKNVAVTIDRFSFDIKRDKRMPDPAIFEKPVILEGLFKLPASVAVNTIDLKQGKLRYTETSEKTGEDGIVELDNIAASLKFDNTRKGRPLSMTATSRLYSEGNLHVKYETIDSSSFNLTIRLKDFNLTALNRVVLPLQSIQIKSGYLKQYDLQITATAEEAAGTSSITYNNLHLEIRRPGESDKKRLGNELLTFLANGILKNKRENATAIISQPRIKHKAIFNYWVKSAIQGAMGGIRRGKNKKLGNVHS
jgi:hypothetical protein